MLKESLLSSFVVLYHYGRFEGREVHFKAVPLPVPCAVQELQPSPAHNG